MADIDVNRIAEKISAKVDGMPWQPGYKPERLPEPEMVYINRILKVIAVAALRAGFKLAGIGSRLMIWGEFRIRKCTHHSRGVGYGMFYIRDAYLASTIEINRKSSDG